jgi:hypothetical protein
LVAVVTASVTLPTGPLPFDDAAVRLVPEPRDLAALLRRLPEPRAALDRDPFPVARDDAVLRLLAARLVLGLDAFAVRPLLLREELFALADDRLLCAMSVPPLSSRPAYGQGFERAVPAAARSNARGYATEGFARTW